MATLTDVRKELFNNVAEAATKSKGLSPAARARALRDLAEAVAWIIAPGQPHGGAGD